MMLWDSLVPLLDGSSVLITVQLGWVYGVKGAKGVEQVQIRVWY